MSPSIAVILESKDETCPLNYRTIELNEHAVENFNTKQNFKIRQFQSLCKPLG